MLYGGSIEVTACLSRYHRGDKGLYASMEDHGGPFRGLYRIVTPTGRRGVVLVKEIPYCPSTSRGFVLTVTIRWVGTHDSLTS